MHDGEPHSAAPLTWLAAAFVAASSTRDRPDRLGCALARGDRRAHRASPCDSARRCVRGRPVGRVARRARARTAHLPRPRVALRRQGPRPRADRGRHDRGRRARARPPARRRARRGGRGRPPRDRRGRARDVLRRTGRALLPRALSRARPAPALGVAVAVEAHLARRAAPRAVGEPARRRPARLRRPRRVSRVPAGAFRTARVGLRARGGVSCAARDAGAARHRLVLRRRPARRRRVGALRALGRRSRSTSRSICCSSRSPCRSSLARFAVARRCGSACSSSRSS